MTASKLITCIPIAYAPPQYRGTSAGWWRTAGYSLSGVQYELYPLSAFHSNCPHPQPPLPISTHHIVLYLLWSSLTYTARTS